MSRKRKRSAFGCLNASNDLIIEQLTRIQKGMRANSNLYGNYQRAITSIRNHQEPITSGQQAKSLKNIGNYLSSQIQAILQKYQFHQGNCTGESVVDHHCEKENVPAMQNHSSGLAEPSSKNYIPAYRKKPWYILSALAAKKAFTAESAIDLETILDCAQANGYEGSAAQLRVSSAQLCTTLKVIERSTYDRFFLTKKGQSSVDACFGSTIGNADVVIDSACDNQPDQNNIEVNREEQASQLFLSSDKWMLVLLLDHREILSRRNRCIIERKLLEQGVTCEVRNLHIGDVIWIARRYRKDRVHEYMLNVIIERKEIQDLSGSIIDRRFLEQKWRLQKCGLEQVIYIVEGSMTQQTTVKAANLESAICRTQIDNQFLVQYCRTADETISFLSAIHRRLLDQFPALQCINSEKLKNSCIKTLPKAFTSVFARPHVLFTAFNNKFRKKSQFTVGEMYQRMMTQVPGMNASKLEAILDQFGSFHEIVSATEKGLEAPELQELRYGMHQRPLDENVRRNLWLLLHARRYDTVVDALH